MTTTNPTLIIFYLFYLSFHIEQEATLQFNIVRKKADNNETSHNYMHLPNVEKGSSGASRARSGCDRLFQDVKAPLYSIRKEMKFPKSVLILTHGGIITYREKARERGGDLGLCTL
jgi:hypothetical protein